MQIAVVMANNHRGGGSRADGLRRPEPAHLQGDAIIPVQSVEQGQCGVTDFETNVPASKARPLLHAGHPLQWSKIVVWGCKMNPLKIFESDEARIKDDRYKKFISEKS
jgi:hypothetical protein